MRRYLGALVTVIVGAAIVAAVLVTLSSTARIPKLIAAPDTGTYNLDGENLKHVTLHLADLPSQARMKILTGLPRPIPTAWITACRFRLRAIIRTG